MEDYSPTPDEVEETPLKKRRFLRGNFLRSWLDKRDDEGREAEGKETSEENKKENWRPQRLSEKLSKIFSNLVTRETVKETDTEQSSPFAELFDQAPERIERDEPEEDFEGLLAVSPDAQMRYYGYELMDEPGIEEEEAVAIASSRERADNPDVELSETVAQEQRNARAESGSASSSTEQIGEVLRRRKTEKLEKRVKRLKKQTKTLKREQAVMKDKQRDFETELAKKQKAQDHFEKVTVPNMEKARQRLQQRLEAQLQTAATTAEFKKPVQERPKLEVKSEARPESNPRSEVNYEQQKPSVELPPQAVKELKLAEKPRIVMERDFERKHEVMDRAGDAQTLNRGFASYQSRPMPITPYFRDNLPTSNTDSPNQKVSNIPSYQPGTSMYKQAMKTGFWSGLALTVILLFVLMFM